MPAPTVSSLPTAPQRTDAPAVFSNRADAWVAAIDSWTDQVNALAAYLDSLTGGGGALSSSAWTMATNRLLGRVSASTGAIEELTAAQVKALLGITASDVSGVAPAALTIETVAGTSYTFVSADSSKHKRFTNASPITATVPKNSTAAIPVGTRIRITAAGAGQITLAPEDITVTLNSRDAALKSAGQYAVFEIEKVAADEWDVLGDVTV